MKLLCTPGYSYIVPVTFNEKELTQVTKTIVDNLNRSIYCNMEFDNVVKRMGFIFEIPDFATKSIDFSLVEREIGKPLELFEGIYNAPSDEALSVSIFTGLSFPEKRIKQIKDVIERDRNNIVQAKQINIFDKEEVSWFSEMRSEEPTKSVDPIQSGEFSLDDLFSNY